MAQVDPNRGNEGAQQNEGDDGAYARSFNIYTPFYIFLAFSVTFPTRVHMAISYGRHMPDGILARIPTLLMYLIPVFGGSFLFLTSRRRLENYASVASVALRILIFVFGFLVSCLYRIIWSSTCAILLVFGEPRSTECNFGILTERLVSLIFTLYCTMFVVFNKYFPRKSLWDLFILTQTCCAALFMYARFMLVDEMAIFAAIKNKTWLISHDESYPMYVDSPFELNVELFLRAFYTINAEVMIVVVSVCVIMIVNFGDRANPREQAADNAPNRNRGWRKFKWALIILISLLAYLIVIPTRIIYGTKGYQIPFTIAVVCILLLGILASIAIYVIDKRRGNGYNNTQQRRNRKDADNLDKGLLYFGIAGILLYQTASLVNSVSLIFGKYPNKFAVSSLIVDIFSLFEIIAQSGIVLYCNKKTFRLVGDIRVWLLMVLWVINFAMFGLDVYDSIMLGVYVNPVPQNPNVNWAMFTRGLGPLNIFFRFHSAAFIAKIVEKHHEILDEQEYQRFPHVEHGQ